ncbi:hypothetical protein NU09_2606 [Flavobacterium beibuense]|uniref:Uncharacterized protein n=1 Tax=Flavobacterium beibuense TaxID=657326 RepID=A0A444W736_9FLAO|nr:hypothetical protein NU09_2606 [Flavobacterium beibuense]
MRTAAETQLEKPAQKAGFFYAFYESIVITKPESIKKLPDKPGVSIITISLP